MIIISYVQQVLLKYRSANNEDSLFLSFYPLDDFVCALGQASAGRIWASHAVEFEEGRDPCERYAVTTYAMQYFEM